MFHVILTIHLILCVVLIGLVLIQQGKGAEMGAAFGGGSNSLFGVSGAAGFITRATTATCILFFITSILLVRSYGSLKGAVAPVSDPLAGSLMTQEASQAPAPAAGSDSSGSAAKAPEAPKPPVAPAP